MSDRNWSPRRPFNFPAECLDQASKFIHRLTVCDTTDFANKSFKDRFKDAHVLKDKDNEVQIPVKPFITLPGESKPTDSMNIVDTLIDYGVPFFPYQVLYNAFPPPSPALVLHLAASSAAPVPSPFPFLGHRRSDDSRGHS